VKCPRCGSQDAKLVKVIGGGVVECGSCGFDEAEELLEVYPEQRATQAAKTKHSPYKRGGGRRTQR